MDIFNLLLKKQGGTSVTLRYEQYEIKPFKHLTKVTRTNGMDKVVLLQKLSIHLVNLNFVLWFQDDWEWPKTNKKMSLRRVILVAIICTNFVQIAKPIGGKSNLAQISKVSSWGGFWWKE